MTTTLDELDEQIKELQRQRRELAKVSGIPLVREQFAAFFEYPIVNTVEWTQYTPFFNDGDPCEFTVHNYLSFNGPEDDEAGVSFGRYSLPDASVFVRVPYEPPKYLGGYEDNPQADARRRREYEKYQDQKLAEFNHFHDAGLIGDAVDKFSAEIKRVEKWLGNKEDFLFDAFGDHVRVVVSRDGVEVEQYDHD